MVAKVIIELKIIFFQKLAPDHDVQMTLSPDFK